MSTPISGSSAGSAPFNPSRSQAPSVLTDEVRAGALWAFIQAQAPRFSFEHAHEVVRSLKIGPNEDHKTLAKRLRKALQIRGIALKHSNALQAVARLSGYSSWHTDAEAEVPRLRLETFAGNSAKSRASEFSSWSDMAPALRVWADQLHASGQLPLGVLSLQFTGASLNFLTPVPTGEGGAESGRNEMWPVGIVSPLLTDDQTWLIEAPSALEKLRRHLEESGKAVLDGYAVLYLCGNSASSPVDPLPVDSTDVVNSELVLLREDDEDDPHSGYEIARGDELTCWHQLELAQRDAETGKQSPVVEISVPTEGSGAWHVNGKRYVWALETLKPNEFTPGRIFSLIGPRDCERLLRRYWLGKRIHHSGFRHHDMTKRLGYLSGPAQSWRVDLHLVLRLLRQAGLTWDGYLKKFEVEPTPMEAVLPVGFVMRLLENLRVEKPNSVFARPTLAEMELVEDDRLLSSLMPRVEFVRWAKPADLNPDEEEALRSAVQEFSQALQFQKIVESGGLSLDEEMPYFVYASDAQELRTTVEELGLRMYVAVSPHLTSTKGLLPEMAETKAWPWALGHAVLLHFERKGVQQ